MKYEKNQYSEGFSFCSLVIAGAFIYWGINTVRGSGWWGLIMIAIGLSIAIGQYYALANRKKLRTIILNEFSHKPNISIEEIEKNTGISKKDIKQIIIDLKGSGELRGTFSSATGEMQLAEPPVVKNPVPTEISQPVTQSPSIKKGRFCNMCGTEIPESEMAKYCPHCGSQL